MTRALICGTIRITLHARCRCNKPFIRPLRGEIAYHVFCTLHGLQRQATLLSLLSYPTAVELYCRPMRKTKGLIRVQIAALFVLAGLVIYRVISGPEPPSGLVVFADIGLRQLRHQAIQVDAGTEVVVHATGSVDRLGSPGRLAAYAWILKHSDLRPTWEMNAANLEAGKGSIVHVKADTFALAPGRYDIFYATFGPDLRSRLSWRNDRRSWMFVLSPINDDASIKVLAAAPPPRPGALWKPAPLGSNERVEQLLVVRERTDVNVLAVGQLGRAPGHPLEDFAWIEQAVPGTRVWQLTQDNSEPAGGSEANRIFVGSVSLLPGIYKAVAQTGHRHAYGDWEANPPYDPASWGITLTLQDSGAAEPFDPWIFSEPLIRFEGVGDNMQLRESFEVHVPTTVIIYSVGEITRPGHRYDYARMQQTQLEEERLVWSMTWDGSVHAGGANKNRREVAFLSLDPGTYTLQYITDGSHSAEDWNASEPAFPDRWGVSLFPLIRERIEESISLVAAPLDADRPILVSWTQLGGSVRESHAFKLTRRHRIHILAIGEITGNKQYDYGWIINLDRGETVWEMTLDNTLHAGGGDENRRFEGNVELEAGDYIVYFETDGSHHYGSFIDGPDDPDSWGITVKYAAGSTPELGRW